jgi:hypothetical protein
MLRLYKQSNTLTLREDNYTEWLRHTVKLSDKTATRLNYVRYASLLKIEWANRLSPSPG